MRYLLIIIVTLILAIGQAFASTWDGELDPNDFDNWKVISVQPTPQGLIWIFVKNPDLASPIDVVAMTVDPGDGTLLVYCYFKHNVAHSFIFIPVLDKYVEEDLTGEEKNRCMKCHKSDKIPGGRVI